MDSFAKEKDFELLERDPYTFFVLNKILKQNCDLIRTDHRDLILCYSNHPHPVWLWTSDDCPDQIKDTAWDLVAEYLPFSSGYQIIMKSDTADYFVKKGEQTGVRVGVTERMYAYDCPSPVKPAVEADGELYLCTPDDVEEAASLRALFFEYIGKPIPTYDKLKENVIGHIERGTLFFWKNAKGETVSSCNYKVLGSLACIGAVLTKIGYRRKHYAQNMVYRVSDMISSAGLTPMLYTDADYEASNSCYEKVGYVPKGKVHTVSAL